MVDIVSRSEWGATDWQTGTSKVSLSDRSEFFVHYHGGEPRHSRGVAVPREVEAIHLGNGWSGVGYNFLVDLDGVAYEGRGWNLQGAHCPGHNVSGFGVYVAIGGDQKPTPETLATVRALYDEACRRTGRDLAMKGHRDGYATACPGPHLYEWVRDGMPAGDAPARGGGAQSVKPKRRPKARKRPGAAAPRYPLPRGSYFGPKSGPVESVSGYYSHRSDLARWQRRMRQRGWSIGVDGLYGPETKRIARAFQKEKGLGVDGLIGPETWAAAWTYEVTP